MSRALATASIPFPAQTLRAQLEDAIEALIAQLDALDGDPDMEPDDFAEDDDPDSAVDDSPCDDDPDQEPDFGAFEGRDNQESWSHSARFATKSLTKRAKTQRTKTLDATSVAMHY